MKRFLPNLLTLANLLSGCVAILYAFDDQLAMAGIFVALGIFFDFFDGLAARSLGVSGELGTQLDSLADMVTSGVVPGIAMYQMINDAVGGAFLTGMSDADTDWLIASPYLGLFGFVITAGSCYRLAKFNIDDRQTTSFIGLPTPANAILIISLAVIAGSGQIAWLASVLTNPYLLMILTIISCYLLNAELPLFALKFKNFSWRDNKLRFVFLLLCVLLLVFLQLYAIPCIIIAYILMSVGDNLASGRKMG